MENEVIMTQENLKTWPTKALYGIFPKPLQENHLDKDSFSLSLSTSYIHLETEGLTVAIQHLVTKARNLEKHCLGVEVIDRSRTRDKVGETMEYVIAGCLSISESAYLGRHNQMAKIVHQQIVMLYKVLWRSIRVDKSQKRCWNKLT
jgi:hypothetical protein